MSLHLDKMKNMTLKIATFFITFLLTTLYVNAQTVINGMNVIVLEQVIIGDDTLPAVSLEPVEIKPKPKGAEQLDAKMKYHARVAYPYGVRVARIVHKIDEELSKIDGKRAQKKYLSSTEKILKDEFKQDLKDLSRTQGRILIKLVYRETGLTVHELISLYRSDVKAGWWQFLAKRFDLNIKDIHDAEGEDALLEAYLQELDAIYQRTGKKTQIENEELNLSVQNQRRQRKGNSNE